MFTNVLVTKAFVAVLTVTVVPDRLAEEMLAVAYRYQTGGLTSRMDSVLAVRVGPKLSSPLRVCQAPSMSIRPLELE
jgi:hypothetical protein